MRRRAMVGGIILAVIGLAPVAFALAFIIVVMVTPPRHDHAAAEPVPQVTSTVLNDQLPVWTPAPTSIPLSPPDRHDYGIPPDPGTGPYPVCWLHPVKDQPCPPKPPGWTPPPR